MIYDKRKRMQEPSLNETPEPEQTNIVNQEETEKTAETPDEITESSETNVQTGDVWEKTDHREKAAPVQPAENRFPMSKEEAPTYVNAEGLYAAASKLYSEGSTGALKTAIQLFEALGSYKDSSALAAEAFKKLYRAKTEKTEEPKAADWPKEPTVPESKKKGLSEKQKKGLRAFAAAVIIIALLAGAVTAIVDASKKKNRYETAVAYYEDKQYELALETFDSISGYKDVPDIVRDIKDLMASRESAYKKGTAYYEEGLYQEAIEEFGAISDYLDSDQYINLAAGKILENAQSLVNGGEYEKGLAVLEGIPETSSIFPKAVSLRKETEATLLEIQNTQTYEEALAAYESGELENAQGLFLQIRDYKDAKEYLNAIGNAFYEQAVDYYENSEYVDCGERLVLINSADAWDQSSKAVELFNDAKEKYVSAVAAEAKEICRAEGDVAMKHYVEGTICVLLDYSDAVPLINSSHIRTISLSEAFLYQEGLGSRSSENSDSWQRDDSLGNTYSYVLSCRDNGWGNTESNIYHIKGLYKYLNATVAVPSANYGGNGWINISGDDVLLWSDEDITNKTLPYDIQIDVEGIEFLTITIHARCYDVIDGFSVYLCDPVLTD